MSKANDKTIEAYEAHAEEYAKSVTSEVSGPIKQWIDDAVSGLPEGAEVLELGSAAGRDAAYMESLGLRVLRTDAAHAFVELLQNQGHTAKVLNAITDPLGGPYDMVFANGVLVHFTTEEVQAVVHKILASLKLGGVFACSWQQGQGERWQERLSAPRYFRDWQPKELTDMLHEVGFAEVNISPADDPTAKWLHVIAKKS